MVVSGRISNSSKLSCMLSLPANMKRIRSRTAQKKWRHHFSHYKPMGIFSDFQGQLTPHSWWSNQAEIRTCPSSHACLRYLQVRIGSDEKQQRKSGDTVFTIITLWELSVAMETRVLIRSGPKPNAANPPPQ